MVDPSALVDKGAGRGAATIIKLDEGKGNTAMYSRLMALENHMNAERDKHARETQNLLNHHMNIMQGLLQDHVQDISDRLNSNYENWAATLHKYDGEPPAIEWTKNVQEQEGIMRDEIVSKEAVAFLKNVHALVAKDKGKGFWKDDEILKDAQNLVYLKTPDGKPDYANISTQDFNPEDSKYYNPQWTETDLNKLFSKGKWGIRNTDGSLTYNENQIQKDIKDMWRNNPGIWENFKHWQDEMVNMQILTPEQASGDMGKKIYEGTVENYMRRSVPLSDYTPGTGKTADAKRTSIKFGASQASDGLRSGADITPMNIKVTQGGRGFHVTNAYKDNKDPNHIVYYGQDEKEIKGYKDMATNAQLSVVERNKKINEINDKVKNETATDEDEKTLKSLQEDYVPVFAPNSAPVMMQDEDAINSIESQMAENKKYKLDKKSGVTFDNNTAQPKTTTEKDKKNKDTPNPYDF